LSLAYPALKGVLGPFSNVAWPWYVLIGTTMTLVVGSLSALTHPRRRAADGG
jgi:hypothetical protein